VTALAGGLLRCAPVGPIRRRHPVQVRDLRFLLDNTDRRVKMTVPGPFTMAQQAQNDHYPDLAAAAMDYAAAVNEEILDLSVETPEAVAARIHRALPHIPAEDLLIAPDCGMKYLPEPVAAAKLRAMVDGTRLVRAESAR
jgi:methionine synthase II (cobalamin-independent)